MELIILILAFLLLLAGLLGAVLPGLPGPPLSFLGILCLGSTDAILFADTFYYISALLAGGIVVLDYYLPVLGTRLTGGTKAGKKGSTIGLVVAVILLPMLGITMGPFGLLGLVAGPFAGAYIAEKIAGTSDETAWKSAIGSFIGFVAGTLFKLIYAVVLLVIATREIFLQLL